MKYIKTAVVAVAVIFALSSCRSQFDSLLGSSDIYAKYDSAMKYFNAGKYQKAATLFESMSMAVGGLDMADTVKYYWGLSNYMYHDYTTAEANLQKFVDEFPRSPFTERAKFLRINCLYKNTMRYELDQSPSYIAISAMNEFAVDYPESENLVEIHAMLTDLGERLDRKAYENAKLYFRMEDYKAARVALRNVLRDDSENIYREKILYYIAKASFKYAELSVPDKRYERYLTFTDDYLNFVGEYPDSRLRRELDLLYRRSQKATGRFAGEDDVQDKDLQKEVKAIEKASKQLLTF